MAEDDGQPGPQIQPVDPGRAGITGEYHATLSNVESYSPFRVWSTIQPTNRPTNKQTDIRGHREVKLSTTRVNITFSHKKYYNGIYVECVNPYT